MGKMTSSGALAIVMIAALAHLSVADVYMHNPAGSNNRNRERNDNTQNQNRLFDSQNNNNGGYPWRGDRELRGAPDPMVYYTGSKLRLEWTAQHSCGENPNAHCQVVIQYGCEDTLPDVRDGYPTGALEASDNNNGQYSGPYLQASFDVNNNQGTQTIPNNDPQYTSVEYGMHENYTYYQSCLTRERNQGLYTADRRLSGTTARYTRQNPGGERHGFECPEERDYYPYWHPTGWRDVAVLTSNTTWCPVYQAESENVKARFYCTGATTTPAPIREDACLSQGGTWTRRDALGGPAPACELHAVSRDNHLGNVKAGTTTAEEDATQIQPEAAHYWWDIPEPPTGTDEALCVLRMRYNISTQDYPSMSGFTEEEQTKSEGTFDSRYNCPRVTETGRTDGEQNPAGEADTSLACSDLLTNGNRPRYNRPYVQMFPTASNEPKVSIALNTDQAGRTFQDRSYVFKIKRRPADVPASAKVWNLNTRGRRGNIVQCYPAVEYDFVPSDLTVKQGDYVHIQWTGSDFNTNRNPNNAEGWRYSDRFNMVQVEDRNHQIPLHFEATSMWGGDQTMARSLALAEQNQAACGLFRAGQAQEQNDPSNCGKMNAAKAHIDMGLMRVNMPRGTYNYISTRNNNFSNRSQKGTLRVEGLSEEEQTALLVGLIIGGVFVVAAIGAGVFMLVQRGVIRLPGSTGADVPRGQRVSLSRADDLGTGPHRAPPAAPGHRAPPPPPKPGVSMPSATGKRAPPVPPRPGHRAPPPPPKPGASRL